MGCPGTSHTWGLQSPECGTGWDLAGWPPGQTLTPPVQHNWGWRRKVHEHSLICSSHVWSLLHRRPNLVVSKVTHLWMGELGMHTAVLCFQTLFTFVTQAAVGPWMSKAPTDLSVGKVAYDEDHSSQLYSCFVMPVSHLMRRYRWCLICRDQGVMAWGIFLAPYGSCLAYNLTESTMYFHWAESSRLMTRRGFVSEPVRPSWKLPSPLLHPLRLILAPYLCSYSLGYIRIEMWGDCLVVQWLALSTSTAESRDSSPDQRTKILQAAWSHQKRNVPQKNVGEGLCY